MPSGNYIDPISVAIIGVMRDYTTVLANFDEWGICDDVISCMNMLIDTVNNAIITEEDFEKHMPNFIEPITNIFKHIMNANNNIDKRCNMIFSGANLVVLYALQIKLKIMNNKIIATFQPDTINVSLDKQLQIQLDRCAMLSLHLRSF